MKHLLNLLAAVALLIWGTHLVRTGILRVFGANLRQLISRSVSNQFTAVLSGMGVTAVVQSSTATALIVSSFVGRGLVGLPAALAVMLGADVGTSVMAVVFSLDLSWLSPLFIFVGVVLFISRKDTAVGRVGRVLIGLGLMLLALRLITESTTVLTQSPTVRTLLGALTSDLLLEIFTGAVLAVLAYSSLATVLLTATLAGSGGIPVDVALGLVVGANLGSGLLAVATTMRSMCRRGRCRWAICSSRSWASSSRPRSSGCGSSMCAPMFPTTLRWWCCSTWHSTRWWGWCASGSQARWRVPCNACSRWQTRRPQQAAAPASGSVGAGHALAGHFLRCARSAAPTDVVESMLLGLHQVIRTDDQKLAEDLRKLDDQVDELYSAIKYYMTKISREALDEREAAGGRTSSASPSTWSRLATSSNACSSTSRTKKIKKGRQFSEAGMEEINELHTRLVANLRLAMSVFLNGNVRDAQKLLEEKARFRDLERAYSATHLARLSDNTVQSIETSSLHRLDQRAQAHQLAVVLHCLPILESAGALAPSRLKLPSEPV